MILGAALNIAISLLVVVLVGVCLLMILVILMQKPKQEGLGAAFGGGMTDQMFGAQTTNVLQKATVWLAALFFALSLLLSILIGRREAPPSVPKAHTEPEMEVVQEVPEAPELEEQLDIEEAFGDGRDEATDEEGADKDDETTTTEPVEVITGSPEEIAEKIKAEAAEKLKNASGSDAEGAESTPDEGDEEAPDGGKE